MSMRQFERLFKEYAGVSPKRFYRVHRFANANLLRHQMPEISWLEVAVRCGYYDLNHLAKEFRYLGRSSITGFDGYTYEEGLVLPKQ